MKKENEIQNRRRKNKFFKTKNKSLAINNQERNRDLRKNLYEKSIQKLVKDEQKVFRQTIILKEIAEKKKITEKSKSLVKRRKKQTFNWIFELLTNYGEFSRVSAANVDVDKIDTKILSKPIKTIFLGLYNLLIFN